MLPAMSTKKHAGKQDLGTSNYIDSLRVRRGLSQDQLAKRLEELGLKKGQAWCSKICRGEALPTVAELRYLAAALGEPLERIAYSPGHDGPGPVTRPPTDDGAWDQVTKLSEVVGGPERVRAVLVDYLSRTRHQQSPPPKAYSPAPLPPREGDARAARKRGRPIRQVTPEGRPEEKVEVEPPKKRR